MRAHGNILEDILLVYSKEIHGCYENGEPGPHVLVVIAKFTRKSQQALEWYLNQTRQDNLEITAQYSVKITS